MPEAALDEALDRFMAEGGEEDDWTDQPFDSKAAEAEGEDLAGRAMSPDPEVQTGAYTEVTTLGMDPVEIMGQAYRSHDRSVTHHEQKLRELEGRRREVKRDLDGLQRARPIEATVIES